MRILIVDDDFVSRIKMHTIMESFGECEAVENGHSAMSSFDEAHAKGMPFDLITLDIAMPEMDGTEVLFNIREIESIKNIPKQKQVKIIMVTSHSDKGNLVTCLQAGCNDYIVKPFNMETVSKKLEQLQTKERLDYSGKESAQLSPLKPTVSSIIEDVSSALRNGEINLPSFPEINIKLKKLIRKGTSINEIENLLKEDFVISSKLIGVSNSVFYKGITKHKTLLEAINRLGETTTQQIVETICNRSLYDKIKKEHAQFVEKLWHHSMSCAYASQVITKFLGLKLRDDAFTLGLFHDIGKTILLQIIDELEKRGKFGEELDKEALFNTLNEYHGSFGASLLERWDFSDGYSYIAKHHDDIEAINPLTKELLVVHFANLLVKSTEHEKAHAELADLAATKSADLLGLTPEMISKINDKVKDAIRIAVMGF